MSSIQDIGKLKRMYSSKTISDLKFLRNNYQKHSADEIKIIKEVIEEKRAEWRAKTMTSVKLIDEYIRKEAWFDFHVLKFDGLKLTIAGGIDLTYFHSLEIIFEDIFFISGYFQGWHSDTSKQVFEIPSNEIALNKMFEIEEDFQLFIFKKENSKNDIIIAANNVSYNSDTVYYYHRLDLQPNERIADFVRKISDQ